MQAKNKIFQKIFTSLFFLVLGLSLNVDGDENLSNPFVSQYINEKNEKIKSLSDQKIKVLIQGEGIELAKVAELNGIPSPLHLLELKDKIPLTQLQIEKIEKKYNAMLTSARQIGERIIRLEVRLDQFFANMSTDDRLLKKILAEIADANGALRYIHLSSHLDMLNILDSKQIMKYSYLRGYIDNPCENIPKGHSQELWLKYNHCN